MSGLALAPCQQAFCLSSLGGDTCSSWELGVSASLIVSCRQILIDSHISFLVAKVLASYGGGLGSVAAPIYSKSYLVKEMTPPNIDPKFACFVPFALVLGLATAISVLRLSELQGIKWWQLQ
jgi:hypothetical protein